ncbi:MAG: hypothetical protein ABH858_07145, partial [Candidatus Omnitrophota bacterium]
MKRILILHISEFGGHKKASQNIREALYFRNPNNKILNINGFGYVYPRSEVIVNFFYGMTIKRFPHLWGRFYDHKNIINRLTPWKSIINRMVFRKFSSLMNEFKPDIVVATQAFPCGLAADYKRYYKEKYTLFAVVTD